MRWTLYCAWLLALIGSLVSLYYGEILLIEPCRLCWYQRLALFPLAVLLGIGLYRADPGVISYAFPFLFFGTLIACYQALALRISSLQICTEECTKPIFLLFGWITFPDLSALGFVLISFLLFLQYLYCRK